MYIQEISIEINTNIDRNDLVDEFDWLLGFYRHSGQTQGRIESQYINENKIVCLPYTLEKNSLSEKYNNFYVNSQIKKIEALSNSSMRFKTVGKSCENYESPCICNAPKFYILITNYISISSPLTCGTCNKPVPLYRLPHYHDHGYMPILSWETNYISCDSLQMNCEVGERWALNQMQNVDSQLSKQGFGICNRIEELTNIPTYYCLYNYRRIKSDESLKPCPICNKGWYLKKPIHNYYDFKCDRCKIVSTKSSNT
jgi:predicted  nucleic acid-binding Zn ribbon protein